jgi:ABC-2 type transport system ATP-binding protein
MTGNSIVRLEGIGKRFPLRRSWAKTVFDPRSREYQVVLDDIHLDVAAGELFGLLGQNGAGKTTLFKILATLVLPDTGTARVAGLDVEREASRVRGVLTPVIPNERSLYWRISAFENLRLYASLHGIWGAEAFGRISDLLEQVGLADAGEKQVGLFSSGMKQRLLIARALVSQPQILLLDEPTRSLDPVTARDLRRFLREEIVGRRGCTVLLATHDQTEVSELCDRVGILERGRLLAVGATADLVRRLEIHRYRVWTRDPEHAAFASLATGSSRTSVAARRPDVDGWTRIDLEIPEGADEAARLLTRLTSQGVPISRFERVELPLAELIERVSSDAAGGGGRPP